MGDGRLPFYGGPAGGLFLCVKAGDADFRALATP